MPWEKSFSEEDAIAKAMYLFWERGYESTSVNELLEETGISRSSLYNAFGGKQKLFVRALEKYDLELRRNSLAELEALDDPKLAITRLFDDTVTDTAADRQKKGCFLVNTSAELAIHKEDVVNITTRGMSEFEAFFRRCIEVGQMRGQLKSALQPETTARVLLALICGIRTLGRGLFDQKDLQVIADEAKQLVL